LDRASARHRSSVAVEILSSRETVSTDALSGGSKRATALSLNACPYLATLFFRYHPQVSDSIEATTILTQRGWFSLREAEKKQEITVDRDFLLFFQGGHGGGWRCISSDSRGLILW
jgi:hypothetical protein